MNKQNTQSNQWIMIESARRVWRQGWRDAQAMPRRAWKEWLLVAGIGWLLVLLFLVAMIWTMQALMSAGIWNQHLEMKWLVWITEYSPMIFSDAVWMSAPGDPIIVIPILVVALVVGVRMGYPLHAVTVFLSYFLIAAIVFIGWQVWDRPRPELILNGIAAPGFHSFPSGHMAECTIVYCLLAYLWLRRSSHLGERIFGIVFVIIWLGMVGIARLEMGTHWATDVIAGTLVGLTWFWTLVIALQRAEAVMESEQTTVLATPPVVHSAPAGQVNRQFET